MPRARKQPRWENTDLGFGTYDNKIPYQRTTNQNFRNSYLNADFQPYNSGYRNSSYNTNFSNSASQNYNNFNHRNFPQNYGNQNFHSNGYDANNCRLQNIGPTSIEYGPRFQRDNIQGNYNQRNMPPKQNYNSNHNRKYTARSKYNKSNTQKNLSHKQDYNDKAIQLQSPHKGNIYAEMNTQNNNDVKSNVQMIKQNSDCDDMTFQRNKQSSNYVIDNNAQTPDNAESNFQMNPGVNNDDSVKDQLNDQTSNNKSNEDWTDAYWQKYDVSNVCKTSEMTQGRRVLKKNMNHLEKTLNNMLAKPVEMSKGKSLLQKMGWKGGGLGKDGDGIVEPIAPNATYAVKTIGLGHPTSEINTQCKNDNNSNVQMNTQSRVCDDNTVQMIILCPDYVNVDNNAQTPKNAESNFQINTQCLNNNTTNFNTNKKVNPWYSDPKSNNENNVQKKIWPNMNRMTSAQKKEYEDEVFTERGYILKETLYRDPELNNDDSVNDEPNDQIDDWTDAYWQRRDDSSVCKTAEMTQGRSVSKKNMNRVEKTLNNMLSKPVEMSKGKSLLQKMGWKGGGLGKDGDGIVEPIAPKATYAVKTIGLGHPTEKPIYSHYTNPKTKSKHSKIPPTKITKNDIKTPEFRDKFHLNVLHYILEFVKNDRENKIVFEPRLLKAERKRIHDLVEKLRESDNLEEFDELGNMTDAHYDLIQDIWVHNSYDLWTESEGVRKQRRIGLYKEAPEHVYLITPEDLNDNPLQTDIDDGDKIDIANITIDKDSDDCDSDEEKHVQNIKVNRKVACGVTNEQRNDVDNNDIEHCVEKHIKNEKDVKNIVNVKQEDMTHMEINVQTEQSNSETNYKDIKEEKHTTKRNNDERSTNICIQIVKNEQNSEGNEQTNVGSETNISRNKANVILSNSEVNKHSIKSEIEENISILSKIVNYFKQFCNDEIFKEFRFLGPFNDDELESINLFFNVCLKDNQFECIEKNELLKLFDDNKSLHVLVDNNGKSFIKKWEDHAELPIEYDEDVICID